MTPPTKGNIRIVRRRDQQQSAKGKQSCKHSIYAQG